MMNTLPRLTALLLAPLAVLPAAEPPAGGSHARAKSPLIANKIKDACEPVRYTGQRLDPASYLGRRVEINFRTGLLRTFDVDAYYRENTTLRGWILLPLAMGITERQETTVAALMSDRLWPRRLAGADILAESTRPTEWGRETYYALRVLFKAGRTEEALDIARRVVQAQIFGSKGSPAPGLDWTLVCFR